MSFSYLTRREALRLLVGTTMLGVGCATMEDSVDPVTGERRRATGKKIMDGLLEVALITAAVAMEDQGGALGRVGATTVMNNRSQLASAGSDAMVAIAKKEEVHINVNTQALAQSAVKAGVKEVVATSANYSNPGARHNAYAQSKTDALIQTSYRELDGKSVELMAEVMSVGGQLLSQKKTVMSRAEFVRLQAGEGASLPSAVSAPLPTDNQQVSQQAVEIADISSRLFNKTPKVSSKILIDGSSSPVRIGDRLEIAITSPLGGSLIAIAMDTSGSSTVLVPNGVTEKIHVEAGERFILSPIVTARNTDPLTGEVQERRRAFVVIPPPGMNRLMVLVSPGGFPRFNSNVSSRLRGQSFLKVESAEVLRHLDRELMENRSWCRGDLELLAL